MDSVSFYGGICRENGKYCQYATWQGYCTMTACINHPPVISIIRRDSVDRLEFEAKMEKLGYIMLMLIVGVMTICVVAGGVFCIVSLVRWICA